MFEEQYMQFVSMALFLVPIIFGMVEFLKAVFNLSGVAVTVVSFSVGILYGGAIFLGHLFPEWSIYIVGGIFILTMGLVASGFYKFADARFPKNDE